MAVIITIKENVSKSVSLMFDVVKEFTLDSITAPSNLVPRVALLPFWSGSGKKREPGNEVGLVAPLALDSYAAFI